MDVSYYLDESGNTGDLTTDGNALEFGMQPMFALACVGIRDAADLEREFARLKAVHNIRSKEVKSAQLRNKPGFVLDLTAYLEEQNSPLFVEVVDKLFFICANMVNSIVLPPYGPMDFEPEFMRMRNIIAEYFHADMPVEILRHYIAACDQPERDALLRVFRSLLAWLESSAAYDEVAHGVARFVRDSLDDFEKDGSESSVKAFLPPPDASKSGKTLWMLPNLSSLTSIYARINCRHRKRIAGLTLTHDEQVHFDEVLLDGMKAAERLSSSTAQIRIPGADYEFTEQSRLAFARSSDCVGIQAADAIAGFVMRHVQTGLGKGSTDSISQETFDRIVALTNPRDGTGINFVLTTRDMGKLGIAPAFARDFS